MIITIRKNSIKNRQLPLSNGTHCTRLFIDFFKY